MVNLDFIDDRFKLVIGAIAIALCFIVYFFLTPDYVEFYLIFPFIIPAIALMVPNDSIRNFKVMGYITLVLVAVVAYFAINGMFNAYDILTNMYVSGQLSTLPVTSDVDACYMGYLMVLLNALFNIITALLFLKPTAEDF